MRMDTRIILLAVVLFIGIVQAEEKSESPEYFPKTHAIQVSPLGLLLGTYAVDYEVLLGQKHGFCLDLLYADGRDLSGNELKGHGFTVGYRYHLQDRMAANFLGVFVRRSEIDGEIEVDDERFSYHFRSLAIGPLYGERHIWKSGVSFSWRLGYGYPIFDFQWTSERRPKHHGLLRGVMKWTTNLESGASLGFAF